MSFVLDFLSPRPRRPHIRLSRATPPLLDVMSSEHHDEDAPVASDADHSSSSPRTLPQRSYPYPSADAKASSSSSDLNMHTACDLQAHSYPRYHTHSRHSHSRPHSFHAQRRASSSASSSASTTPAPSSPVSRTASPCRLPVYVSGSGASASSCSSEDESDPDTLLLGARRHSWRQDGRPNWLITAASGGIVSRRGRRRDMVFFRSVKRMCRRLVRHPCFPKTPFTIVSSVHLSLCLFPSRTHLNLAYLRRMVVSVLPFGEAQLCHPSLRYF